MSKDRISRAAFFTEVTLILAALLWGCNYAATKYATDFFPPLLFVALRFTIGGVLLLAAIRLLLHGLPMMPDELRANLMPWEGFGEYPILENTY